MKKILFSLFTMLFAVGVFAQYSPARQAAINNISITTVDADLNPEQRAKAVTNQMTRALGISAAQSEAMYKVNLDAALKMEKIAKYVEPEIVPRKYASLFKDTNAKILRILEPEQQVRYNAIIRKSIQYKKMQSIEK